MITNNEKIILKEFQQTRIPSIYKLDNTDNILYVEHVTFDLCDILLKNKKVNNSCINEELKEFAQFLLQINITSYDNDAKSHLKLLLEVVNIFLKNNL